MKAYIQTGADGEPYNVNAFVAKTGFKSLGFETFPFQDVDEIEDHDPEAIFVGGVGSVRKRLDVLGFLPPVVELEYPSSLLSYCNRKIWVSTLQEIACDEDQWGIFIKPKSTKVFEGRTIRSFQDFIGLDPTSDMEIWCSDLISVETEWRCFVRYQELLDVRYYKGAWDAQLNVDLVRRAIQDFEEAPAAYCLDFGVDTDGTFYLIEVNDGHSLGSYGMGAISYAKFLSARWAEMTNTTDYLNF